LQGLDQVVQQVRTVNVEKLYLAAPARAQHPSQKIVFRQGFFPLGEALPDVGPAFPLGTYAKSIDPPPLSRAGGGADSGETKKIVRSERYFLLNSARYLLLNAGKKAGLQHPANYHRTAKCKHVRHGDGIGVHMGEHKSAFFSGLVTCGSVWACPVCTAKVQERRRLEIAQGIEWAYKSGYQPMMITLTFPHYAWQKLGKLQEQQAKALALLRSGAPWKRFVERENYQGLIRSLELTHGQNGWHLHTHELWFLDKNSDPEQVKATVLERWKSACARAGLLDLQNPAQVLAFENHSVDVIGNCSTSDYLAKMDDSKHWGADREMAKATSKAGKASGKHPFGLLADYANRDLRAGRLFLAYVLAMKGKRQIFWTKGLKARAGVGEVSDEVLAEEQRETAECLGMLDDDDWQTVRCSGARAQVLDAAEAGGWAAVAALIEALTRAEIQRLEALLYPHAGVGLPNPA
jgi:hypothetical protein